MHIVNFLYLTRAVIDDYNFYNFKHQEEIRYFKNCTTKIQLMKSAKINYPQKKTIK